MFKLLEGHSREALANSGLKVAAGGIADLFADIGDLGAPGITVEGVDSCCSELCEHAAVAG